MKTLKHPYILSYIESADYEDSLVLVTEGCIPLERWLTDSSKDKSIRNDLENNSLQQELLWGLKCILEALQFLHTNNLVHNYLGLHSIFVAKSGDWKIGALDLIGNMTVEEDFNFLKSFTNLLNKPYISPEREQSLIRCTEAERTSKLAVGSPADIYSLAYCIQNCFKLANLVIPDGLSKYFSRMMSTDPKRRPTASQLSKCPVFSSESIQLMASLGELAALKPANESLEVLGKLVDKVPILPTSICVHKILPSLARTLQMACTDFNNRDSREACRQVNYNLDIILDFLTFFSSWRVRNFTFFENFLNLIKTFWPNSLLLMKSKLKLKLKFIDENFLFIVFVINLFYFFFFCFFIFGISFLLL